MKIGAGMGGDNKDLFHHNEESDDEDDSSSRSSLPEYVSYRRRPEWWDVEPICIKTQSSIMDIKYTTRYQETFSYFRAMLVRDELSERSLALTADCIELQRSNFSVWYFRRRILKKLTHHLADELAFIEQIIEDEPKNYQVWHHRKTIVEWLRDGSSDKQLTASVLAIDNKNYHAWQHRQWVTKEFALWDGEIEFTNAQLAIDVRNNSAWNHRFFVVKETRRHEDSDWVQDELQNVKNRIEQLPTNESAWSYLRGLLTITYNGLTSQKQIYDFCDKLYISKGCRSSHLLSFMLDMIYEELTKSNRTVRTQKDKTALKKKADDICETLKMTDQVRSRYWSYIGSKMKEL